MMFEVWVEGYAATGNNAAARKIGDVEADNFRDACEKLCGQGQVPAYNGVSIWGCRLFDNEADARREFG